MSTLFKIQEQNLEFNPTVSNSEQWICKNLKINGEVIEELVVPKIDNELQESFEKHLSFLMNNYTLLKAKSVDFLLILAREWFPENTFKNSDFELLTIELERLQMNLFYSDFSFDFHLGDDTYGIWTVAFRDRVVRGVERRDW